MKYYSDWQTAFIEFIMHFGKEFEDSYNLAMEFERHLHQNRKGTYYIVWP